MANTVDRTKENHFILLDRAIALKNTGDLMELVDPRLDSEYDVQEVMVVTNHFALQSLHPRGQQCHQWLACLKEEYSLNILLLNKTSQ
ncbi:Concanavalin A-like lectin/glucanase, subgroup [Artemisia annua]|uniref:Concanavalin A-like lectin/glucanase, subgroup n=1 Tax=Artemisia annua TaxID=35608 RepID=A0A2U1LMC0_ARTAN|nr:Concanavalin A-like lectin/glucanase, subgroup [Artemisia annua]